MPAFLANWTFQMIFIYHIIILLHHLHQKERIINFSTKICSLVLSFNEVVATTKQFCYRIKCHYNRVIDFSFGKIQNLTHLKTFSFGMTMAVSRNHKAKYHWIVWMYEVKRGKYHVLYNITSSRNSFGVPSFVFWRPET